MVERAQHKDAQPPHDSLLERRHMLHLLSIAHENLRRDGDLQPMLFVDLDGGDKAVVQLELPETSPQKRIYLAAVGMSIRSGGQRIREAVFLSEAWYVEKEAGKADPLAAMPSQHPARREAILLTGRNAEHTRMSIVLQPFARDRELQPIFDPIVLEQYNVPPSACQQTDSLVVALFPANDIFN